jgi:hypothetical protein
MATIKAVETWTGPGKSDGVIVPLGPEENAVHTIDHKNYFEHWYFDAKLSDGHVVIGFLQASELINRKPGVELHVYKPSGEKLSVTRLYSKDRVSTSTTGFDVRIGDNYGYAEFPEGGGLPTYKVHLAEEDMQFDLTYHNLLPGWKPGGGMTRYGDTEFFAWVVPSPKARVEGTVRFGGTELEVRGIGYQDHNWGVGDMKRIIAYWYWGRLYVDEFTLLYAYVMTQNKYGNHCSTPLMLAKGDQVILSTGEMTLAEGPAVFNEVANRDYPSNLLIEVPGKVRLKLDVKEVIDAHNFLEDLPVVRSKAIQPIIHKLIGRPGYFRFDSEFELHVEHKGETFDRSGTTLHEMVALK